MSAIFTWVEQKSIFIGRGAQNAFFFARTWRFGT